MLHVIRCWLMGDKITYQWFTWIASNYLQCVGSLCQPSGGVVRRYIPQFTTLFHLGQVNSQFALLCFFVIEDSASHWSGNRNCNITRVSTKSWLLSRTTHDLTANPWRDMTRYSKYSLRVGSFTCCVNPCEQHTVSSSRPSTLSPLECLSYLTLCKFM